MCIGSVMVDVICPVASLPRSGEGVIAESAEMRLGGCAFNSACAATYAGGESVLVAPLGTGPFASFARSELEARTLRMCALGAADEAGGAAFDNGAALCLIEPDGERTMITIPGIDRNYESRWFEGIDASRCAYAVVCGYEIDGAGGDAIIGFLEANPQIEAVFAPGPPIMRISAEKMARIFALHPLWHLNDLEIRTFTGCDDVRAAARELSQRTRNAVVVTQGAAGALVCSHAECVEVQVPAEPVDVVNTTGAGDSHVGALLARRAAGDTWEEALAFANRVSGIVCGMEGGAL